MAEKQKKEGGGEGEGEAKKGGGLLTKTPVILGAVMFIEAIALFVGFKMLSPAPSPATAELVDPHAEEAAADAHGEEAGGHGEKADAHGAEAKADDGHGEAKGGHGEAGASKPVKGKITEVPVLEFRAPNKLTGRTFIYDVSIFALTKGEHAERVKTTIKDREATIKDRIRTIIAQSDPDKLGGGSEPGLETLRRQVKYQLDEIVGDGMIDEVVIPRCIPFRADY